MKTSAGSIRSENTAPADPLHPSGRRGVEITDRLHQSGSDLLVDDTRRSEDTDSTEAATLAVVEESLAIETREVETGAVRVHKIAHTEQIRVPVHTSAHRITVDRVAVDREVDQEFPAREEGDTLIVPVFEYRPVVIQRLFLKEEVRITKHIIESVRHEDVSLRKEELVVERREGESGPWRKSTS